MRISGSAVEIESWALGALCQRGGQSDLGDMARRLLANYRWHDAAHEALFQIVMSFPSPRAEALREHLPAQLTRRGFPDFDFEALFAVPLPSRMEAEKWLRRLRDG